MSEVSVDRALAVALGVILMAMMVLVIRRALRTFPVAESPARQDAAPDAPAGGVEPVRCPCGEAATEPAPTLERGRGSVLRDLLAMPPRYRRVVRQGAPAVYCRAHAHVADARLAEFVATRVRAVWARAYADVAIEAAAFETETLPRLVSESLTEEQRRRARRGPGVVRALPKTGTDEPSATI